MNPYKNSILAISTAAMLAIATAAASRTTAHTQAKTVRNTVSADTMSLPADSLIAATPLFDRLYLEAVTQQLAGNDSTAMTLLDSCAKLRPDAAEVYYQQAKHYINTGIDSLATRCLERAAELQPGDRKSVV